VDNIPKNIRSLSCLSAVLRFACFLGTLETDYNQAVTWYLSYLTKEARREPDRALRHKGSRTWTTSEALKDRTTSRFETGTAPKGLQKELTRQTASFIINWCRYYATKGKNVKEDADR
jgi:hypothetical protein